MAEGDEFAGVVAGISASAQEVPGPALLGAGLSGACSGTITDDMIKDYIDEQEGGQIVDDSQFPIDPP